MSSVSPRVMAIMALTLLSLPAVAVSQIVYNCTNTKEATEEFRLAMKIYSKRNKNKDTWQEAIRHLEKAAEFCPVPKNPIPPVVVAPFRPEFNYIPFYFLGDCHFNAEEPPDALRSFYLSSCFGEPKRDEEATENLGDLTGQCLKQIVQQQRPEKQPPYFGEGVTAAKMDKDWKRSAERMWDSMQVWPEDGKTTIIAGRWPAPYVPRFHLANALFEIGCGQKACEQLKRSKLKELAAKDKTGKYVDELEAMAQLEAKCATRKGGPENMWICQQWQCWLQRDRQAP